jgi:hypothetical protein
VLDEVPRRVIDVGRAFVYRPSWEVGHGRLERHVRLIARQEQHELPAELVYDAIPLAASAAY